jgi:hypothetical protein
MRIGFTGLGTMGNNPATNTLTQATQAPFSEAGKRYAMSAGETTLCNVIEDDEGIDLRIAGDWVKPWDVAPHINAPRTPHSSWCKYSTGGLEGVKPSRMQQGNSGLSSPPL